ncbi:Hypothetical predicted protein [Paramuricea clavata]|uniref:DNA 3'-5' helicase n=1 Tax=Paramuricea clavata TaxID=317549 RepID=A0A6S7HP18_PARCT|nr:Hypothetical predicted protein [Paramuricea clavata]
MENSVSKAIAKAQQFSGHLDLKEYQRQTIEAYLSGRDVFVSAQTGYGKSLTFELAPHAFEYLSENNKSLVLVVVPLVVLYMKDQVSNLEKDSLTEEAFRSDYGRLAELRSLVHKNVPFIALTATATEATRKTIIKDLCMRDCVQILGDPNKQNIRYTITDVDHKNLYDTFKPIINELEEKQINTTKVMVFCRRKDHVKELFELFTQCLGQKAYYRPTGEEPINDRSRLFAMYHKKAHSLVKKTVETEFCKENGTVRVVFCTIAFGMGVNIKGGNVVIHLGPSGGLDEYLQECGRVGRDKTNV